MVVVVVLVVVADRRCSNRKEEEKATTRVAEALGRSRVRASHARRLEGDPTYVAV